MIDTSSPVVLYSSSNNTAYITINRPAARNALNQETVLALNAAFVRAKKESARVVLLASAGDEAFCAGADVKELLSLKPAARLKFFRSIATLLTTMAKSPFPIVAKVHGYALAGGCGLAAASDIILASDDAKFGLPEINIGLVPMIVSAPIERAIGRRALMEIVLTGEIFSAEKALQLGLITRIIAKIQLENETAKLLASLATKSPLAMAAAKKAVLDIPEKNYLPLLNDLAQRVGTLSKSPDTEEGIRAFLEKRPAQWKTALKRKNV